MRKSVAIEFYESTKDELHELREIERKYAPYDCEMCRTNHVPNDCPINKPWCSVCNFTNDGIWCGEQQGICDKHRKKRKMLDPTK